MDHFLYLSKRPCNLIKFLNGNLVLSPPTLCKGGGLAIGKLNQNSW